ncbi:MAG: ribbon-helix-helix domain-containing protein [bacterium]|nr:ribbon-helix-helix domain-containing protein [bacterium]MDE0667683.1 ribbon-helix-helix domain-containing protein [bacterium]
MRGERTEQIAVRLPASLLADVDELVSSGVYASRAALARAGIENLAASERARLVDAAIAEGYRRFPSTGGEQKSAVASLRDAILDEPW